MTKRQLLDQTEVFLLDLDGTVYLAGEPIGDMLGTLSTLRSLGKKIVFLTNNSSRTEAEYLSLLAKGGFYGEGDLIFSSATATVGYLKANFKGKKVHLLATDSIKRRFCEDGIILDEKNPDVCVLAYDTTLSFDKLKAFNESLVGGAYYIATHPDLVCPTKGVSMPDVGSFIEMFKASCGRVPDVICGKPYGTMLGEIERETGVNRAQMCMVGDRLTTDIRFGTDNGIPTICVLSGEATSEDISNSPYKPTLVLNSFNDIL